jgi:hypothetical protein
MAISSCSNKLHRTCKWDDFIMSPVDNYPLNIDLGSQCDRLPSWCYWQHRNRKRIGKAAQPENVINPFMLYRVWASYHKWMAGPHATDKSAIYKFLSSCSLRTCCNMCVATALTFVALALRGTQRTISKIFRTIQNSTTCVYYFHNFCGTTQILSIAFEIYQHRFIIDIGIRNFNFR